MDEFQTKLKVDFEGTKWAERPFTDVHRLEQCQDFELVRYSTHPGRFRPGNDNAYGIEVQCKVLCVFYERNVAELVYANFVTTVLAQCLKFTMETHPPADSTDISGL